MADGSVEALEETVEALSARVRRLETAAAPWLVRAAPRAPAAPEPPILRQARLAKPAPGAPESRIDAPSAPRVPQATLEDLVGGRVLAWAGGLAMLAGVVLLFAIAVSSGWIGEAARTLLAATGALALGVAGVWLHEHRGRTEAALVATATSIATLFVSVAVASQGYALIPSAAGTVLAVLVGAVATGLALRWRAQGIAALGIVGGLLAPVLAGAGSTFGTMTLLWVAAAAATAVVVHRRWAWLAVAAYVLGSAQWIAYLLSEPATSAALVVLVAFGALNVVAALGHELRVRRESLAAWSSVLLALNAVVLAAAGWLFLDGGSSRDAANLWLTGVALMHVAAGVYALRSPRLSHDVGISIVAVGVLLSDLALGVALDGAPRALSYAAGAVAFAAIVRWLRPHGEDSTLLGVGLGGHVCLAISQLTLTDARPELLTGGRAVSVATLFAVLAIAVACFSAARLTEAERPSWRTTLDALGLVLIAYLTALAFDGTALVAAWAAQAGALAVLARRHQDRVAEAGIRGFGILILGHALAVSAPPVALVDGLPDVAAAAIALGCAALVALTWPVLRLGDAHDRALGCAAAGVALLYLASAVIVSAFQPEGVTAGSSLLEIGVRQQGQVALSALWGVVGTVGVIVGLHRDLRPLRLAALGLLVAALAKLVGYDLATLTSVYRVGSCVVIGGLLLLTGFVWQRLRPREVPDLRSRS